MTETIRQMTNDGSRYPTERHMPMRDYSRHHVAVARRRHALAKQTHVIVGDHEPERIVNHDACDANDGTTVAQCYRIACQNHNRCCFR
jgi:hypothetical protein